MKLNFLLAAALATCAMAASTTTETSSHKTTKTSTGLTTTKTSTGTATTKTTSTSKGAGPTMGADLLGLAGAAGIVVAMAL